MEKSLETRDYLAVLWRRRWLIALALSLASGSALWLSTRTTPVYVARAAVFIGPRSVERADFTGALQELLFSKELVASYAAMFERIPLLQRVIEQESAPYSPTALRGRISTRVVPETRIVEVSVSDTSPERAQRLTNGLVGVFLEDLAKNYGGAAPATMLEPAVVPGSPVSPVPIRDGVLGGLLGLMVGIGGAILLEQSNTMVRTREDAERWLAPLPVLATVPLIAGGKRQVLMSEDARSPASEAFRILRTGLHFLSLDRPIQRLLVSSPYAQEGKTTVAANLAAAFAIAGFRTVLVDADLRRPMVHQLFGLSPGPGLSEILLGVADARQAVRPTRIPNLHALTAGMVPPNPAEVLGSGRMLATLNALNDLCDIVVLDAPPALPVADAGALAPFIDGVLLVARAGRTRRGHARHALEVFERLGARALGVVLNGMKESQWDYYYRLYYRYESLRSESGDLPTPSNEDSAGALEPVSGRGVSLRSVPASADLNGDGSPTNGAGPGERTASPPSGPGSPEPPSPSVPPGIRKRSARSARPRGRRQAEEKSPEVPTADHEEAPPE